jgi:hypothetical protein
MSSLGQRDYRTGNGTGNGNTTTELTLERRLELLETRFTKPENSVDAPQPLVITTKAGNEGSFSRSSNSQHSFSFSASNSMVDSPSHSNLPSSAVRSKRRPSLNTSFHAVERATARHLRKVAANSPVQGVSINGNATSNLSRMSANNSNASQQTLLTSHVQRIVAESPPAPVTPGMATTPNPANVAKVNPSKPAAARNILQAQTTNPSNGGSRAATDTSGTGSTTTAPVAAGSSTVSVAFGLDYYSRKLEMTMYISPRMFSCVPFVSAPPPVL